LPKLVGIEKVKSVLSGRHGASLNL